MLNWNMANNIIFSPQGLVVCKQLGWKANVGYYSESFYGDGVGTFSYDNLGCTGSEENINSCSHSDSPADNCDSKKVAGVVCGDA